MLIMLYDKNNSITRPWFHFVLLLGHSGLYDGTVFAAQQEIVFVSINYRLGILGKFISCYLF